MPKFQTIIASIALSLIILSSPALAQVTTRSNEGIKFDNYAARGYFYENIKTDIAVNTDTSFDVSETQTYSFTGEYHQGWRTIPLNKIDSVTDITVIDTATGRPLAYSASRLDKTNSASWGRYTFFKQDGAVNIEWYFNAKNENKSWILKYRVHGGLTFNQNNDQLYWNIFTDYSVPVKNATVNIALPQKFPSVNYFSYRGRYSTRDEGATKKYDPAVGVVSFSASTFAEQESFTVDIDWPRGAIDRSAYLLDFAQTYYGYIGGALIILFAFLFALFYWLRTEVWVKGRGVIIPQYEPPKNLPPAIMQVVLKESTDTRALPATIIDLAVRGYVSIEQKNAPGWLDKINNDHPIIKIIGRILLALALAYFLVAAVMINTEGSFNRMPLPAILYLLFIFFIFYGLTKKFSWGVKDFEVKKIKEFAGDDNLTEYERLFLSALFSFKDTFSTKEAARAGNTQKQMLYQKIKKVDEQILKDTELKTGAFAKPVSKEKYKFIIIFGVVFLSVFFIRSLQTLPQWGYLVCAIIVSLVALGTQIRFEAALNQTGHELKEEILGFKMFLYTAERYRLQNLTPDMFQKFLPYAMVFGIEKKWAKPFASMQMPPPNWYHAGFVAGHMGSNSSMSGMTSGFSATAFSASFASSFSSAFASSGAGGSSGGAGGGSSGGGGGGGGGGAS
ncbi:MAG: DUF2207 domain-containing protein [Candidatus Magasanikbacteria bacterium]|jgi:uncharacterized membrane protein YgcG